MEAVGLTDEQWRRIEENKRQALLKRQQQGSHPPSKASVPPATSSCFNSGQRTAVPPSKLVQHSSGSVSSASSETSMHSVSASSQWNKSRTGSVNSSASAAFLPKAFVGHKNQQTGHQFHNSHGQPVNKRPNNAIVHKQQFYGAPPKTTLKGQCVLIAKDRFEVNIGFHQATGEVFKSMKSRIYDAGSRKCHFHIREHDSLLKAVSGLRPEVEIEPLPKAILRVFGKLSSTWKEGPPVSFIPQADLSQVDSVLVDALMPFQREGVNFGVHLNGRVLIADDMGLGKTLQAICMACVYRDKWPVLIVTPSSVRFDWAQQFKRWMPSLDPDKIQVAVTGRDNPASGLVNIISYDLLSRKVKQLTATKFQVIIMDESHFLKNSKSVRTKAALPLLQAAQHVILLSGTPALSRPSELFTQIVAVYPRLFKFHDFGVRYCEGKQQPWGWDYSGSCNMGELQLLLEEKVMIRRLKRDVLSQLPAKRRQMVLLDPVSVASSKSLIAASRTMEQNLTGMQKRGALLQYFQETCKVKVAAIRNYVKDMVAAEKKFIIFAHHKEMLDSIEDAISKESVEYMRIDGRTTSEQRNFFCRKFQSRDECRVAILSITAANAGLNLSAAPIVVFAELFWNPGILVQAEDRAHRLGQQDSVLVYYLVAQKTADDYIWPLVQNKLQVLGKAGLAKDDFKDTDTTQMKDPKQRRLMDMFEESFIEETSPEEMELDSCETQEKSATDRAHSKVSPAKRQHGSKSSPCKPQTGSNLSPGKLRQTGINQFFPTSTSNTASSHSSDTDATNSMGGVSVHPLVHAATGTVNSTGGRMHKGDNAEQCADVMEEISAEEWDTEVMEEVNLAAVVDWDDDSFGAEPDEKKPRS